MLLLCCTNLSASETVQHGEWLCIEQDSANLVDFNCVESTRTGTWHFQRFFFNQRFFNLIKEIKKKKTSFRFTRACCPLRKTDPSVMWHAGLYCGASVGAWERIPQLLLGRSERAWWGVLLWAGDKLSVCVGGHASWWADCEDHRQAERFQPSKWEATQGFEQGKCLKRVSFL